MIKKKLRANPKFKVAEIAIEIDDEGNPVFWAYNYGFHPGQGGQELAYGNLGTSDLESTLNCLRVNLTKDENFLVNEAKQKTDEYLKFKEEDNTEYEMHADGVKEKE